MNYDDDVYDENLADEYEYYDEWLDRDDDLSDMSLEEYDNQRRVEDYGYTDDDLEEEE